MKIFLRFLIAIIVIVCLGSVTYYFLRNDEVIAFKTNEVFMNEGDILTLSDLQYSVKKKEKSTKYNFNAGGDGVTSVIEYDVDKGFYVAQSGGSVTLIISTSNSKFKEFKINVHVGDGSVDNPYFISRQADLEKIGDSYPLNSNYILRNDITLTSSFRPVGYNSTTRSWEGFYGKFDGNGKTISGLNLSSDEYNQAGLFYSMNSSASVTDLIIKNAVINGNYSYAGALSGKSSGIITRVQVNGININNTKSSASVGGLVGLLTGNTSKISLSYVENGNITTTSSVLVGGLVGEINLGVVQAAYASASITATSGSIGGLVGYLKTGDTGSIEESYSISTSTSSSFASLVGQIVVEGGKSPNKLKVLVGNYAVGTPAVNIDSNNLYSGTYYDNANALYHVVTFASLDAMKTNSEFIYYAISTSEKIGWDTTAWNISTGTLPKLNMTVAALMGVRTDYYNRDLTKENIGTSGSGSENTNAQSLSSKIVADAVSGVVEKKSYILTGDMDFSGITWTQVSLKDVTIDGKNKTISNLTISGSLFKELINTTIKDINFTNVKITNSSSISNLGVIADKISSSGNSTSTIQNVKITFASTNINVNPVNFGAIAGETSGTVSISSVTVDNMNIVNNSNISTLGGIVAVTSADTTINSSIIKNSSLNAKHIIGALVATNRGTIRNSTVQSTTIKDNTNQALSKIGGVVAINNGTITGTNAAVNITISNATTEISIGGVAATNGTGATITNTKLTGSGITLSAITTSLYVFVGGLTAENNGTINNTYNYMSQVGSYISGKNLYSAGITVKNNNEKSKIEKVLVTSNIYGNYVSGIVCEMTVYSATIDQVYVGGNINSTAKNTISGDKFVAGISYKFESGSISNVQAQSTIEGKSNNTVASLMVLYFPEGARLSNSTINSSASGYGTFYKDAYVHSTDKSLHFNIYVKSLNSVVGDLTSCVVNSTAATTNGKTVNSSYFINSVLWFWDYDVSGGSFYKDVNSSDFGSSSTYSSSWNSSKGSFTQNMTFSIGSGKTWQSSNIGGIGIQLTFLSSVN